MAIFGPREIMQSEQIKAMGDMADSEAQRSEHPRPPDTQVVQALRQCRIERERMAAALRKLEQWDMLHLTPEGRGAVTADAPWARALIAEALGDGR